ncbi:hypothetical protein ABK040_015062 [Willaertia magna]
MSSLEEFFSDDADVPQHFICPLSTTIFIDPVILNGRIYERQVILQWITKDKTDPFTRESLTNTNNAPIASQLHSIYKSAIGLDIFMKQKVESFFQKIEKIMSNEKTNREESILLLEENDLSVESIYKTMIRFLACYFNYLATFQNIGAKNNNSSNLLPEHYEFVKKNISLLLQKYFQKDLLLKILLQESKNNKFIFDKIINLINESFENLEIYENNQIWNNLLNKNNDDLYSIFGNDIYIQNNLEILNISNLKNLAIYLYQNKNKNLNYFKNNKNIFILKKDFCNMKPIKTIFTTKFKRFNILLNFNLQNKEFKILFFKVDQNNLNNINLENIYENNEPNEEIILNNKINFFYFENKIIIQNIQEKKKWLLEIENDQEEWFYLFKYCILFC